jgi:hypothetical protein
MTDYLQQFPLRCHPRESGGPGQATEQLPWIPAFAGMTWGWVGKQTLLVSR